MSNPFKSALADHFNLKYDNIEDVSRYTEYGYYDETEEGLQISYRDGSHVKKFRLSLWDLESLFDE